MDFLTYDDFTLGALFVIDYLENLQQARDWFYGEVTQGGASEDDILKIMNDNTGWIPQDTIPFELITKIGYMIPYLNIKSLPMSYINNILNRLFTNKQFHLYHEVIKHKDMRSIPHELLDEFKKYGFILYDPVDKVEWYSDHDVFNFVGDINGISPRIANYYPNKRIYKLDNRLISTSNDEYPYLVYTKPRRWDEGAIIDWTHDPAMETFAPINNRNQNTNYKPYSGYDTGIKVLGKKVFSYNPPSLYGRDYYIFLPHEYDPFTKTIYAFSL